MNNLSPVRVEQAMSSAEQFIAALRESDPDIDHDDLVLALDSETDALDLVRRAVRAAIEAEGFADALAERMKALAERKARFCARAEAARGLAQAMLEALGVTRLADPEFTASIGRPRTKIIVTDLDALPEAFVRVTRSPDMSSINAAAKAGQVPPGCVESNAPPSLTIRTR